MSFSSVSRMMAIVAITGSLASSLASVAAAATVSLTGGLTATLQARDSEAWKEVDTTKSTVLPNGSSWTKDTFDPANPDFRTVWELPTQKLSINAAGGDPCRNACSPFYGGVYKKYDPAAPSAPGWETIPFWVVFDPKTSADSRMAELTFGVAQRSLSLLWGSPDNENMVELFLKDTLVGSFAGSMFEKLDFGALVDKKNPVVKNPGSGAALLTLSGVSFDKVRFSTLSGKGSFEFANIRATPVPVPASLLLLLTGLGAVVAVGRRRRA